MLKAAHQTGLQMLQEELLPEKNVDQRSRIGDVAAMLRVMRPLNGGAPDLIAGRRRLLADLCRFIGVKVGSLPPESLAGLPEFRDSAASNSAQSPGMIHTTPITELSPRQEQTLKHLLNGDSEKQVARKLKLSPHTVHVHVKALYRRYGVSSRAELLAKHFHR